MTTPSPWLLTEGPRRPDGVTLFCLPYAGGGASIYRGWRQGLPDHVQLCRVQLPGRETRFAEPPLTRMEALLDGLADALAPWLDRPFALFGHSMGGVVAAALTRRLDRTLGVRPRHLFISGSRPPHLPVAIPLHGLPPNDFLAALRRDGGTPDEVLDCPELMDVFTPVLRADHAILETWGTRSCFPLPVPVTCFAGTADTVVPHEAVSQWRLYAERGYRQVDLDAGHFFVRTQTARILSVLSECLAPDIRESRP